METVSIFTIRLNKFAKNLQSLKNYSKELKTITLNAVAGTNFRIEYEVNISYYLTSELAIVFPIQWHFNKIRQEYTLKGIPDYAQAEAGIGAFFNMSEEEFLHCFSLTGSLSGYHSPTNYGGKELTEKSRPSDIAKNLLDLAAYRNIQTKYN